MMIATPREDNVVVVVVVVGEVMEEEEAAVEPKATDEEVQVVRDVELATR